MVDDRDGIRGNVSRDVRCNSRKEFEIADDAEEGVDSRFLSGVAYAVELVDQCLSGSGSPADYETRKSE